MSLIFILKYEINGHRDNLEKNMGHAEKKRDALKKLGLIKKLGLTVKK